MCNSADCTSDAAQVAEQAPRIAETLNRAVRAGEHLHVRSRRHGLFGANCPDGDPDCADVTRWAAR